MQAHKMGIANENSTPHWPQARLRKMSWSWKLIRNEDMCHDIGWLNECCAPIRFLLNI